MSKTHVPAWKRLGLTLKHAKDESQPTQINGKVKPIGTREPPTKKRRVDGSATYNDTPDNRMTNDQSTTTASPQNGSKNPKKQVSFTTDTKTTDGDTAVSIIPSEAVEDLFPQFQATKKSKKQTQSPLPSSGKNEATLEYLALFYKSNSKWKFNKNREVWILKHALSTSDIPPSYNLMLAQYIYGLKSPNTRSRLRQECAGAGAGPTAPVPCREEAGSALASFPETILKEDSNLSTEMQAVARPELILWALDPSGATKNVEMATKADPVADGKNPQENKVQKKRKNRTAVIEYSSSSSSETESDSSSESESDDSTSESGSDT